MHDDRIKLFNYRPLVNIAGGMCIGLIFSELLGSISFTAVAAALLICTCAALRYFGYNKYALFIGSIAYGLLTTILSAALSGLYVFSPNVLDMLDNIRGAIKGVINSIFGESSGMVNAMLLGDREALDYFTSTAYQVSGIAHILALSGLHISIFSGAILFLIPANKPLMREIIVGAFLLIYCILTGFPPSLVRASVMTLCLLSAPMFSRRTDSLSSISAAAIILMTFAPEIIKNVGFQLSFAAVIGITLLYAPIKAKVDFFGSAISSVIAVSISATLGTLPLMLYHFQRISIYSLLSNIIILPMVSVALISALVSVCLFVVSPSIAGLFAFIPRILFSAISYFAKAIAALPLSEITLPRSSVIFTILCYVAMIAISPYCFASTKLKRIICGCSVISGVFALLFAQIL